MKRALTGANRSGHLRIANDDPNTERIHDMPDILEAAGDLIRTAVKTKTVVTVDAGEWELFVHAFNATHDRMDELASELETRQDDEFVRLHEARMAAA